MKSAGIIISTETFLRIITLGRKVFMQIQAVDANIFNIGIDCFALILLCIIFSSGHDRSQNDLDASNFSLIIRMAIIATVFDILTWIEIEFPSSKQVGYAYLINCMLFFFQNVSIFCWLNYSLSRIYRRPLTKTELKKYWLSTKNCVRSL